MTTIEMETAAGITRKRPLGRTVTPASALTWRIAIYLRDRGKPLATVEPDTQYAGMWRIHMPDGWVSDMANLSRAKEAAIRSVLFVLNRKETATEAPPVAPMAEGVAAPREAAE